MLLFERQNKRGDCMQVETTATSTGGLLTAKQLHERIPGFPFSTIYRMAAKHLIPSVPIGVALDGVRFIERDVRDALANLKRQPRAFRGKKKQETANA